MVLGGTKSAQDLFPSEVWDAPCVDVYVARSRRPRNKTQDAIFAKELQMAEMLAWHGHVVYLLPEYGGVGSKHPDALVDGVLTEFKWVTGDVGTVGKRFNAAKKQGNDVFLKIDTDIPLTDVYRKIKGEVAFHKYTGGTVYVWIGDTLHTWLIDAIE